MPEVETPSTESTVSPTEKSESETTPALARDEIFDQSLDLTVRRRIIIFLCLAVSLVFAFIDQVSLSTALPTIARDLNAEQTIAWAGIANLVANTSCQVLYGRLSDIWGRKPILLSSIALLCLGDLLCSVASSPAQLYGFRAMAGVGSGGLMSLSMMTVSDICTLRQRGRYQGLLGGAVGIGGISGPFMAAALTQTVGWRWLFRVIAMGTGVCIVQACILLPKSRVPGNWREKVHKIDYYGTFTSVGCVIFILIPISGGGSYYAWDSPLVISMLIIGTLFGVAFCLVEWKVAVLPMLPLHLFRIPTVSLIMVQNVSLGVAYFGDLYMLPIYYQNVLGLKPIPSSILLVALPATQSVTSITTGQILSRTGRFYWCLMGGYIFWTCSAIMKLWLSRTSSYGYIIGANVLEGMGVGSVFQTSLVGLQAICLKKDRAVVTSARNFVRYFGASCGLAICSAILTNTLKANLPTSLPAALRTQVLESSLAFPNLTNVTPDQLNQILDAYMAGSHAVFVFIAPVVAVCIVTQFFVKDNGAMLKTDEDKLQMMLMKKRLGHTSSEHESEHESEHGSEHGSEQNV
jgi:MFS family permease